MKRVGFVLKPQSAGATKLVGELAPLLVGGGHACVVLAEDRLNVQDATIVPEATFAEAIDIAVVLGGDGTMLRASALCADDGVPVLGVNLGRLGFLTPFTPAEAKDAIESALAGELPCVPRTRLAATYHPADGDPVTVPALNDTVIHQGAMARLVDFDVRIDDRLAASYRSDGLIIATPTGSTAYSLAAGGPIVVPALDALVLTPICAHTLTSRPLMIPTSCTVSIRLAAGSRGVVITVDGAWGHTFNEGDRLDITADARPLELFDSGKNYFDILREKLHWDAPSGRSEPE